MLQLNWRTFKTDGAWTLSQTFWDQLCNGPQSQLRESRSRRIWAIKKDLSRVERRAREHGSQKVSLELFSVQARRESVPFVIWSNVDYGIVY